MQEKSRHGALDELTNTLDYTFIDLPELVDGTWVPCSGTAAGQHNHHDAAENAC
jgi:hypothetical protein